MELKVEIHIAVWRILPPIKPPKRASERLVLSPQNSKQCVCLVASGARMLGIIMIPHSVLAKETNRSVCVCLDQAGFNFPGDWQMKSQPTQTQLSSLFLLFNSSRLFWAWLTAPGSVGRCFPKYSTHYSGVFLSSELLKHRDNGNFPTFFSS